MQSNRGERTGFFELLATVAGQFLQDVGEERDEVKFGDQEIFNKKPSPSLEVQAPLVMFEEDHIPFGSSFSSPTLGFFQHANKIGDTERMNTEIVRNVELNSHCVEISRCDFMALEEEQDSAFVKDMLLDEGNYGPLQNIATKNEVISFHQLKRALNMS